jgi:hypothetical protein
MKRAAFDWRFIPCLARIREGPHDQPELNKDGTDMPGCFAKEIPRLQRTATSALQSLGQKRLASPGLDISPQA